MTMTCHLAIISSSKVVWLGVETLLSRQQAMTYEVSAFADHTDFINAGIMADVLLLDTSEMTPDVIAKRLEVVAASCPDTLMMATSWQPSAQEMQAYKQHGVRGYVHRALLFQVLVYALELLLLGLTVNIDSAIRPAKWMDAIRLAKLKEHDEAILHLMAQGKTTGEIAETIGYSDKHVQRAQQRLREVLEVRVNDQIVDAARQQGLLDDIVRTD